MRTHTYSHSHVLIHTHVQIHYKKYKSVCMHTRTHMCKYKHTQARTCVRAHTHTHTHTHSHTHTLTQVEQHTSNDSAWFVYEGKVYDATPFLEDHPGGADSILIATGADATEDFNAIHSNKVCVCECVCDARL